MKSFGAHSFPLDELFAMEFVKLQKLAELMPHTQHFEHWECTRCVIDDIIEERKTPHAKAKEIADWLWFDSNPADNDSYFGTEAGYNMLIGKIEDAITKAAEQREHTKLP